MPIDQVITTDALLQYIDDHTEFVDDSKTNFMQAHA